MEQTSVPAVFPEPHVLEKRFHEFLGERGLTVGDVVGETDQGHGRPALAVASGSVLAGFGNHRSDLDLLVLVENDRLTRFPIQSHEHGTLIDVNIRQASAVRDRSARLRDGSWPCFDTVTQDAWNHRRRTIKTATRLALGLKLIVSEPWETWHAGLREPWLVRVVEQWWTVEAHRLARAAGLLAGERPAVAAIRGREAVVAALNARAAVAGQIYFTEKWIGEKLRAVSDDALGLLREVLAPPLSPAARVARCLDLVQELTGPVSYGGTTPHTPRNSPAPRGGTTPHTPRNSPNAPLHTVLRWAKGIGTARLEDRTIVDRWQLRALEIPRTDLPPPESDEVLWSGPPGTDPPPGIALLFVHDMLWLGVAPPQEVS